MNTCKRVKKLDEELAMLASTEEVESLALQARLVGAAYEGTPTQEKALVYVFEGSEYLVPFINVWDGVRVVECTVRLDLAERVVSRPHATSRMSEMQRTKKITPKARLAVLNGVKAWFLPEKGFSVRIVPFPVPELEPKRA